MADYAKAEAGRDGRAGRWRNIIGIGCVVALHGAALYALLSTEYGPFAITLSLLARMASRQDESFSAKVVAALRNQFGGHAVKSETNG